MSELTTNKWIKNSKNVLGINKNYFVFILIMMKLDEVVVPTTYGPDQV